jgi:uncharacterized membrane protein
MDMNTFSAGEMIRFGWETFKKRPWFFVGIQLVIIVVGGVASQMSDQFDKGYEGSMMLLLALVGFFVGSVIHILIKMGTISFALKANESAEAARFEDLWAPAMFWKYLLASIVVGLIVVAGLILFIVPGIVWALRYMFVPYLVVDRGLGVRDALTESSRITYGHTWELLLLILAIIGINILGLLALVVGLLVSLSVTMFALAHAYRTLEHTASEVAPAAAI